MSLYPMPKDAVDVFRRTIADLRETLRNINEFQEAVETMISAPHWTDHFTDDDMQALRDIAEGELLEETLDADIIE